MTLDEAIETMRSHGVNLVARREAALRLVDKPQADSEIERIEAEVCELWLIIEAIRVVLAKLAGSS